MNHSSGPSSTVSSSPAIARPLHGTPNSISTTSSSKYQRYNGHSNSIHSFNNNRPMVSKMTNARLRLPPQRSSSQETDSQSSSIYRHRDNGNTNLQSITIEQEELLYDACLRSDIDSMAEILNTSLREGQRVERSAGCLASMHEAARRGYLDIVNMLIDAKCDFEIGDRFGMRPLLIASWSGHLAVVKSLVEHGADITARNKSLETILHLATKNEHLDVLMYILNETDLLFVNEADKDGQTPLHLAVVTGNVQIVQLLIDFGADSKIRDSSSKTATHRAADFGHAEIVSLLLDLNGSSAFERDAQGKTPLHIATSSGYLDVVEALVEYNSDVTCISDDRGRSALHIACANGNEKIAEYLLSNGSVVNAADKHGDRPLHEAIINNHVQIVKLLATKGQADLNAKNYRQQAPLHVAAESGFAEIIDLLITHGADLSVRETKGRTALYMAARGSHTAIVDLLIKAEREQSGLIQATYDSRRKCSTTSSAASFKRRHEFGQKFLQQFNESVKRGHFAERNISIETTDTQVTNGCESGTNDNETQSEKAEATVTSRQMKDLLKFLSKNCLSNPEDWKNLAFYWNFTHPQVQAIEHQFTGKHSHRDHSYRMLLIWYHGLPATFDPVDELIAALIAVGRSDAADKVKKKSETMAMSRKERQNEPSSPSKYIPKCIPSAKTFCHYCVIS